MSNFEAFDLDADISEVADLVAFTNPPAGTHVYGVVFCGLDTMGKDEKEQACVKLIYQKVATLEKVNESDLDAANGSIFSENYGNNDDGRKYLKARLKDIFGADISGSFAPYIAALQEKKMSEFMLKMTTTINKSKSNGVEYENVRIKAIETIAPMELPAGFEAYDYTPATED